MGSSDLRRMRRLGGSAAGSPQRGRSPAPALSTIVSPDEVTLRLRALDHSNEEAYSTPVPTRDSTSSESGSEHDRPRTLLRRIQCDHKRSSLAHTIASRNYRRLHRKFTFWIMLLNTVGVVMQQVLQGSDAPATVVSIFNSAMFSTSGGLTSINNFLGYGALEMKHLSMRNEHNAIYKRITDALSLATVPGVLIDWRDVLDEIRELEKPMEENGTQLPEDILQRFLAMSEADLEAQTLG